MTKTPFDPSQHLSTIKGQEYLEVKWRLAWLRAEQPDAVIETELVSHVDDRAIFSAKVQLPDGGSATGWGSETAASFGNYIEKAETKAIGRALAALGFGTQFCQDFDDGAETGVLADAPVQLRRSTGQRNPQEQRGQYPDPMTQAQKGKIMAVAKDIGMQVTEIEDVAQATTGTSFTRLTKTQASRVIENLLSRKNDQISLKAS